MQMCCNSIIFYPLTMHKSILLAHKAQGIPTVSNQ